MSDIMIEESVAFPWTCSTKRGCHAWQRGPPSQQLLAKIFTRTGMDREKSTDGGVGGVSVSFVRRGREREPANFHTM